jgi:hypothetical protein
MMTSRVNRQELVAHRKAAGHRIKPETARISWGWGYGIDPYGDFSDLTDEAKCVGRLYFARPSCDDDWISFCDIPDGIRHALLRRMEEEDEKPFVFFYRWIGEEIS